MTLGGAFLTAETDIDGRGRVDDSAFVRRLLCDGGMPALSERPGRDGRGMVICLPLVWSCGRPGAAQIPNLLLTRGRAR